MTDANHPLEPRPSAIEAGPLATSAERLERLQAVVDGVRDCAIVTLDSEGTIVGWSAGAADAFGYQEWDAVGRTFAMLWSAEDAAAGEPARELARARELGLADDDRWLLRADGRRIFVRGTTRPFRNAAGELAGYVKVCRDETERQAQAESLSRAAAIIENSNDAIVSKSLEGVIRTWNPAAERLFGYPAAEAIGRPIQILFPP